MVFIKIPLTNTPLPGILQPVILLKLSMHNTSYISALLCSFHWILVPAQAASTRLLLFDFAAFLTEP